MPDRSKVGWQLLNDQLAKLLNSRKHENVTLLEWLVPLLSVLLEYVSLTTFEHFLSRRKNVKDIYALVWLGVLTSSLVTFKLWVADSRIRCLVLVLACFRAFDITKYRFYSLLVEPYRRSPISRRFVFLLVNFGEAVVAHAILYLLSGQVFRGTEKLASRFAAFYYSLVTMVTLGYGDYAAKEWNAQLIVVAQITTSLVFLVFIIPTLVSLLSEEVKCSSKEGDAETAKAKNGTRETVEKDKESIKPVGLGNTAQG
jgi:hypothetical protein